MRREKADTRQDGFTLVEMVIAISILAVVILAAGGMLNSGLRALAAAKARARANEITTQGIEDLQRFSFNNMGLCAPPSGTAPAGLEDWVPLSCPSSPAYEDPCHPTPTAATVPRSEYDCTFNNITYTVKRYVSYADALKQTKRLAVYVEWNDLAGRHQVSQQSSLRAPDQAAITGLAPPTFATPTPSASPTTLTADATGRLTTNVFLTAKTSQLNTAGSTNLPASGGIPAHTPDEHLNISVVSSTTFPVYNGFPITIGGTETMTVVAGAGTTNWTVRTTGTSALPGNSLVTYPGDKVFANFLTIGTNGSPQQSTVILSGDGVNWTGTIPAGAFTFGFGTQYVSFGILRAADGKTTSAFATTPLTICPAGGCSGLSLPYIPSLTVPTGNVPIGTAGDLKQDLVVEARTLNVTSADSVTVSFLTQSGSITVQLSRKPGTSCPGIADATPNVACDWVGTLPMTAGYRFSPGTQSLFFGAAQIEDHDPATIDHGSTGVRVAASCNGTDPSQCAAIAPPTVTFVAAP